MKKISRDLAFTKTIIPVIWLGLPIVLAICSVMSRGVEGSYRFLLAPALIGVFGYFSMKKMFGSLADEVYDCETYLLVKFCKQEQRIELSDVMNVNVVTQMNPPRISLRLRTPGKFGTEVSFSPVSDGFTLKPFAKNKTAEDLIARVDRANSRNSI